LIRLFDFWEFLLVWFCLGFMVWEKIFLGVFGVGCLSDGVVVVVVAGGFCLCL